MTNNGNTYRHVNRIIKILILWCLFVLSPSVFCQEHSFVDSLYSKQIQSLNLNIDLPYNQILAANINQQIQQRSETATKLGIFFTYSVLIDSCLTANNLPSEFRYIPLAVSNMNNGYQDKYQRKGVWALPYAWAVKEQLLINDTIDERLDIGKATFIAIKRLKTIYFQDENIWHAIIAYANSIQNLNKSDKSDENKISLGYLPCRHFGQQKYHSRFDNQCLFSQLLSFSSYHSQSAKSRSHGHCFFTKILLSSTFFEYALYRPLIIHKTESVYCFPTVAMHLPHLSAEKQIGAIPPSGRQPLYGISARHSIIGNRQHPH